MDCTHPDAPGTGRIVDEGGYDSINKGRMRKHIEFRGMTIFFVVVMLVGALIFFYRAMGTPISCMELVHAVRTEYGVAILLLFGAVVVWFLRSSGG